ncbi:retrovirus-related pol polyprotein from transposon TNT 1-94 [Tanacetum coccineum]
MLPSTGRISSTNDRGSKPRSNTKNDRIPQPSSRSMKNKVEAHHRKFKSSANKNNHVSACNANIKNVTLSKNSDTICLSFIMGYGDLQMWNILISRVYYVEGLGHNLFSVRQFCDSDLEVAFRKHTSSKIKSWLWHRHLSHLNFDTINKLAKQGLVKGLPKLKYSKDHLCLASQMGKSKKESYPHKPEPSTNEKLQMLHMDLCGLMRVESINKKRYILVAVDDYSQFTWVKFLRTKDDAPEIIIKFLKQSQVSLNATVRYLGTENDTEFLNQTLRNYTKDVGITHNTSTARLVLNQAVSTSTKPPTKNDWDLQFQPMFDEYFKNPSVASNPVLAATLPLPATARASFSFSTSIAKDAPSLGTSTNIKEIISPINSTNVERNEEVAEFDSDTLSIYLLLQTPAQLNHPLVTIIGDPSKLVSTRRQLTTNA